MNPEIQRDMIKDAKFGSEDHETQARNHKLCSNLANLNFNGLGYTDWFDQSEHEGKLFATRVRRLSDNGNGPQAFRVQVGLMDKKVGDKVGASAEQTYVHEYAQISFPDTSDESMKRAKVGTLNINSVNKNDELVPQLVDEDSEEFKAVEYTLEQAVKFVGQAKDD